MPLKAENWKKTSQEYYQDGKKVRVQREGQVG